MPHPSQFSHPYGIAPDAFLARKFNWSWLNLSRARHIVVSTGLIRDPTGALVGFTSCGF